MLGINPQIQNIIMDIIKPGVVYSLDNFKKETGQQQIRFTEKLSDGNFEPGTTNEEVIDMMIDRFHQLNMKRFSAENQCSIMLLKNVRQLQARRLSRKITNVINYKENHDGK